MYRIMSNFKLAFLHKPTLTLKVEEFYELNSYTLWYSNFNQHTLTYNLDNIRINKEASLLEDEYEEFSYDLAVDKLLRVKTDTETESESDFENPLQEYYALRTLTITSFFASHLLDIPRLFNNIPSIYRKSESKPHLKLVNILMRHGLKERTSATLNKNLNFFFAHHFDTLKIQLNHWKWRHLYSVFQTDLININAVQKHKNSFFNMKHSARLLIKNNYKLLLTDVEDDEKITPLTSVFEEELSKYKPVFSFFIKKVDKLKRKHSRGKTGKYTVTWQYVPSHKRLIVVQHWFSKDVRFQKQNTFSKRLRQAIETLFLNPKNSNLYKFRSFVHKFVFQKYKNTLLKTLSSV